MIKIIVDISSATESEIKELNKLIPFGSQKFHFDKNNIKVDFFTKQDAEIVNANMSIGLSNDTSVKPFVLENAQLEVIHIIDRGQSYDLIVEDINDKKFIADTKNYMNKIIRILETIENTIDSGLSNRLNEDDIRNVCNALEIEVNNETIEYLTSQSSQKLERFINELVKNMRKQNKY